MHFKKKLALLAILLLMLPGCDANYQDIQDTRNVAKSLVEKYPTPTDIETSLSRYNLIRRAYFLSGDIEKAKNYPCDVEKPQGYIYLFLEGVGCVVCDTIDGIPTSMRSYLTPDSDTVSSGYWLADVDGTYGENPDGIFYFDKDGMYHEWVGPYYYSETYFEIEDLVIEFERKE